MKNPNPKELDESTVQYWIKKLKESEKERLELESTIKTIRKQIYDIKRGISNRDLGTRKNVLAQWQYIKWRMKHSDVKTEKVEFT